MEILIRVEETGGWIFGATIKNLIIKFRNNRVNNELLPLKVGKGENQTCSGKVSTGEELIKAVGSWII